MRTIHHTRILSVLVASALLAVVLCGTTRAQEVYASIGSANFDVKYQRGVPEEDVRAYGSKSRVDDSVEKFRIDFSQFGNFLVGHAFLPPQALTCSGSKGPPRPGFSASAAEAPLKKKEF